MIVDLVITIVLLCAIFALGNQLGESALKSLEKKLKEHNHDEG